MQLLATTTAGEFAVTDGRRHGHGAIANTPLASRERERDCLPSTGPVDCDAET